VTEARVPDRIVTRTWAKWSWLLVLAVMVALSLDYHCRRLPTTASGYFARGRADYLQAEYESAIENFTRSIELDPKDAEGYIWRGEAHAKLQEFEQARSDLARALALRPDYAKSHAAAADGRAAEWNVTGAIEEFTRAIELDSEYGRCYLERGKMYLDAKRYDDAVTDLRKAAGLTINDYRITAQLLLWVARARAGDRPGANAELASVVPFGMMKQDRFRSAERFLTDEITETVYLEGVAAPSAGADDRVHAEAFYLAAAKRLLGHDDAGALPLLRRALDTDPDGSSGYERARVELADMLLGLQVKRADDTGLVVTSVRPGGPADAAGLKAGGTISSIGGAAADQDAFVEALGSVVPGSTVAVQVADASGTTATLALGVRLDSSAPTR
jgi:tetratricopeptide (TPR) repeat protein